MSAPGSCGGSGRCEGVWVREPAPGIRGLHRAARSGHRKGHVLASERGSPQSELGSPLNTPGKGWSGVVGWRVRTRSGLTAGPEALDERGLRLSRMGPEGGAKFREVTQAGTARDPPRPLCSAGGLREPKVV